MNAEQIKSLISSIVLMIAAALVSKGYTAAGTLLNSQEFIGFAAAALALLFKHSSHAPDPTPDAPAMPTKSTPPPKGVVLAITSALIIGLAGCSTSAQKATYQASSATDAAVIASMTGWGVYVGQYHPGTNAEYKVKYAFDTYRASQLAIIDATAALATQPGQTNALAAAVAIGNATKTDLIQLISTITNK